MARRASARAPARSAALAALGLEKAVLSLTRPTGAAPMDGPAPTDDGDPLAPYDRYGHDLLYWLDRMVRSRHQLVERLALVFHDWFATSNDAVGSARLMLDQTNLFRAHGLGIFNDHGARRSRRTRRCSCSSTRLTTARARSTRTTRAS